MPDPSVNPWQIPGSEQGSAASKTGKLGTNESRKKSGHSRAVADGSGKNERDKAGSDKVGVDKVGGTSKADAGRGGAGQNGARQNGAGKNGAAKNGSNEVGSDSLKKQSDGKGGVSQNPNPLATQKRSSQENLSAHQRFWANAMRPAVREDRPPRHPGEVKPHPPVGYKRASILILIFGVVLPASAIGIEAFTHVCARELFDPFPTTNHMLLCMLIPISNFMYWTATQEDMSEHYAFMALSSGMAMGVGILYSLMFLPVVPAAVSWLFYGGIGALPLAPLLALPATLIAGKGICKLAHDRNTFFDAHQAKHFGHLIILVMVIAVELPSTLTRINLGKAVSDDQAVAADGIKWLRNFGNREVMLRACYEHSGRATDIIGSLYENAHKISVDDARRTFYKVTGQSFNTVPLPASARATIQHTSSVPMDDLNANVTDEFDLDPDIAGETVSGMARGLSSTANAMNVTVTKLPAMSNIHWVMDFANVSDVDREVRAKLTLPYNGVVDGAKIWIDGVPRTASIMSRSEARTQYVASVHEKKDPLLVSASGLDQVLVQCYPVAPKSQVKVDLSITAPLYQGTDATTGKLTLPAFAERNFVVDKPVDVTMHHEMPIASVTTKYSKANGKGLVDIKSTQIVPHSTASLYQAKIDAADLSRFNGVFAFQLPSGQKLAPGLQSTPADFRDLKVLVDGSVSMAPHMEQIADALSELPPIANVTITFVGDVAEDFCVQSKPGSDVFNKAIAMLKAPNLCRGGQDDSEELAGLHPGETILWIHGAQPARPANASIAQVLRYENKPRIYDLQTVSGPDELVDGAAASLAVVRVPNVGSTGESLHELVNRWKNSGDNLKTGFSIAAASDAASSAELKHNIDPEQNVDAQIWQSEIKAKETIIRLLCAADAGVAINEIAANIASQAHIVTPVSSLIVKDLESTPNDNEQVIPDTSKLAQSLAQAQSLLSRSKPALEAKQEVSGTRWNFAGANYKLDEPVGKKVARRQSAVGWVSPPMADEEKAIDATSNAVDIQPKILRTEALRDTAPMQQSARTMAFGVPPEDAKDKLVRADESALKEKTQYSVFPQAPSSSNGPAAGSEFSSAAGAPGESGAPFGGDSSSDSYSEQKPAAAPERPMLEQLQSPMMAQKAVRVSSMEGDRQRAGALERFVGFGAMALAIYLVVRGRKRPKQ